MSQPRSRSEMALQNETPEERRKAMRTVATLGQAAGALPNETYEVLQMLGLVPSEEAV